MNRRRWRPLAPLLLLALSATPAPARQADAEQPVHIRARAVEVNEKTGVAIYRGRVSLTQGSLRIDAERVEVTMQNEELKSIRASGQPAKAQSTTDRGETVKVQAKRIDYDARRRQLDLHEQAVVQRERDVMRGTVIHYNLQSLELFAEGGDDGQVTAVVQPRAPAP